MNESTRLHMALAWLLTNGLAINNLFQRQDGQWQCNLRGESFASEFGLGPTLEAALEAAIERWRGGEQVGTHGPVAGATVEPRAALATPRNLEDLGL